MLVFVGSGLKESYGVYKIYNFRINFEMEQGREPNPSRQKKN
jgi:hypothetical protein